MVFVLLFPSLELALALIVVGSKSVYSGVLDARVPIWVALPFVAVVVTASMLSLLWRTRDRVTGPDVEG